MKVGMIFECGPKGADKKVCTQLVSMIDPEIEIVSMTLDNKAKLVAGCGQAAAKLLREGLRAGRRSSAKNEKGVF